MNGEVITVDDVPGEFVERVVEAFLHRPGDGFSLVLSGGATARRCYERLASDGGDQIDWWQVDVYWGDERCVPPDDERANVRLVREALASASHPPVVHPVATDLPPREAAAAYDESLAGVSLDLAFQGLGPDGHTASLFPDAPSLDELEQRAIAAAAVLAPWVDRVTMTVPMLCSADEVVFLAVGEDKADAVRRAFAEPPSPATPASLVRSLAGRTVAILDPPAARELSFVSIR